MRRGRTETRGRKVGKKRRFEEGCAGTDGDRSGAGVRDYGRRRRTGRDRNEGRDGRRHGEVGWGCKTQRATVTGERRDRYVLRRGKETGQGLSRRGVTVEERTGMGEDEEIDV